jgi:hypothetical protein
LPRSKKEVSLHRPSPDFELLLAGNKLLLQHY